MKLITPTVGGGYITREGKAVTIIKRWPGL
jgi:hypothetical protein